MAEKRGPEILRGTHVTIDLLLVRHAEREPIDPERIKSGWSPPITRPGLEASKQFGAILTASDLFYKGDYSGVHFTSTSLPRTSQTAQAIREGARFASGTHITEHFPKKGERFDDIFRLRTDGQPWNSEVIAQSAAMVTPRVQEVVKMLCKEYEHPELVNSSIEGIILALRHDSSKIASILLGLAPPGVAKIQSRQIVSALYDGFLPESEADAYSGNVHEFLTALGTHTLRNIPAGKKVLMVAVTHDFNLAGMLRGMVGIPTEGAAPRPIRSLEEVGGPPDYLSHLLFRLSTNSEGVLLPSVYYNFNQYGLLPKVQKSLTS